MQRFWLGLATFACLCATFVWAQTPSEFKGHDGLIQSVAVSSDGAIMATASVDGTVKVWDFAKGKETFVLKGHTGTVNSVAFNKDASILASAGADKSIRFWNPKDGKGSKELKGHTDGVISIVFSPDGSLLASAGSDKTVRLWDVKDAKELKNLGAHEKSVYSVAFNTAGTELASTGDDGIIKIWDVKGLKEIKSMKVDLPKPVIKKEEKKEEPKDKDVKDKKVGKKDMAKKEEPKELRDAFSVVVFSPDGKTILTVGQDKFLRYWDIAEGKETKKIGPTKDWIFGMALSKDGKLVATAGYGGSLRVYEVTSGKEVYPGDAAKEEKEKNKDRQYWITHCIAFTPDGKSVVTGHEKSDRGVGNVVKVTVISPDLNKAIPK
jgi:WD40 repeat protein